MVLLNLPSFGFSSSSNSTTQCNMFATFSPRCESPLHDVLMFFCLCPHGHLKKKKKKRNRRKRKRGRKFQPLRPVAQIWPDAIGSPERARVVAAAALNYTWSDMWRVKGANIYASERKPHREEKWHPPQKNAKLCSIYGKKKINKWMCALMQGEFGPLCCWARRMNCSGWVDWTPTYIHAYIWGLESTV